MKKSLVSVIVGILVISLIPISAFAEDAADPQNPESGTVTVLEESIVGDDSQNSNVTEESIEDISDETIETGTAVEAEEDPAAIVSEAEDTEIEDTEIEKTEIKDTEIEKPEIEEADVTEAESGDLKVQSEDLLPPVLVSAKNNDSGILFKFKASEGAESYNIYRSTDNSNFTKVGSVTETEYQDSSVTSGQIYYYTASAVSSDEESDYTTPAKSMACVPKTSVKNIKVSGSKATISWLKTPGVTGYIIFCKKDGGNTTKFKKLSGASTTSYTFKIKTSGNYEFAVTPYVKSAGKTYKRLFTELSTRSKYLMPAPAVTLSNNTNAIIVNIKKAITGAKYYKIYKKTGTGKWKYLGRTKSRTYKDKKIKTGTKYTYYATAVHADSESGYANTKSKFWIAPSTLKSAKNTSLGVKLTWSKVSGADKYYVYRKEAGGEYKKVRNTTKLEWTDCYVDSKTTYYYVVKAVVNDVKGATTSKSYKKIKTSNPARGNMISMAQKYSSPTGNLIMIDCRNNFLGVFEGSQGNWKLKYFWRCSTGAGDSPTVKGVFSITTNRGYSFGESDYVCYYYSGFYGGYLIHSTKFYPGTFEDLDPYLGGHISHGCVRLYIDNAKWIYYNIAVGTTVVTYPF